VFDDPDLHARPRAANRKLDYEPWGLV
jgi:hypothetical protein